MEEFLAGRLPFARIVATISDVIQAHGVPSVEQELTVDDVLAADAWARDEATRLITEGKPSA